jgi:hypothetical protein
VLALREKRAKEGKKVPEVVVIDARKKASASAMKYFPRAVPVPFALHYIEKSALGAVCRALCCCIYVEGEIRFPSPTPESDPYRFANPIRVAAAAVKTPN